MNWFVVAEVIPWDNARTLKEKREMATGTEKNYVLES
jgi:hypothetical protein